MFDLGKDIRFAFRMLTKSPLVTGAAVLSLALGIGANTTIFTLFNAVLLRALPVSDPGSLVAIYTTEENQSLGNFMPVSRPNYEDIRDGTEAVFSDVVDILFNGAGLATGSGEPEPVNFQMVTSNYFSVLGVGAQTGRVFVDQGKDDELGSEPVAVLSHRLWEERFGADPAVVGQTVRLNRLPLTIIGVAPPGFQGTFVLGGPDLWVPMSMRGELLTGFTAENVDERRALISFVFARLRDGANEQQASDALASLATGLRDEYPVANKDRHFAIVPIATAAIGPNQQAGFQQAGGLLMVVVGLVLLIACGNVANLLLGRAAARRREIGVRLSLGASRARLARQLMCESLLLAVLAGGLGLLFAVWARKALWAIRPPFLNNTVLDLSFDPRVLLFTLVVTLLTGVLFGLAPAIRFTRPDIVQDLTQSSDSAAGLGRLFSYRNLLLVGQIALSAVALVGSGLFIRSLGAAMEVDLGYQPDTLASLDLNIGQAGYDEDRGQLFLDQVLERTRSIPGVESASLTTIVPLTGGGFWRTVIVEGRADNDPNHRILVPVNSADTDLLATLGVQLLRGRDLTAHDRADAPAVALINQAMAERFWPDEDPLGQRFHFIGQEVIREVVGVVGSSKHQAIGESPQPQVYVPRRQSYSPFVSVVFRAKGDPETVLGSLRSEIRALDADLPINNVQTAATVVHQGLWPARMGATLLGVLGSVALILAAVGIYGVMAYTVGQRDREIAIRMALGADRWAVLRLILWQAAKVVALGLTVGLGLAVAAGQGLSGLLYGVSATDLITLGVTSLVLAGVGFLASFLPARRATGVDPTQGLRFER